MAEALGQQIVEFSVLVRNSSEAALSSLRELFESSPELSDTERKIGLLKYILKTRQRLLRLLSLSKWCRQVYFPVVALFHSSVSSFSPSDFLTV